MKKWYLIFGIVVVIATTVTACRFKENISKEEVKNNTDSPVNPPENEREIMPVIDNADEWSKTL